MSVINSKATNSNLTINFLSTPVFNFQLCTASFNIAAIQYDQSDGYLNFFETTDLSSSKMSISNLLISVTNIIDSNTTLTPILYDVSTVSIANNVLIVTSIPSNGPVATTMTTLYDSNYGTLSINVIGATVSNIKASVATSRPLFTFDSNIYSPLTIVAIHYDSTGNEWLNFCMNVTPLIEMSILANSFTNIADSCPSTGTFYSTSTASISNGKLILTSGNYNLTITP